MSWSNIVDYCEYKDFHRLSQSCSCTNQENASATVHYVYSMNGSSRIKGAFVLDYGDAKVRALIQKQYEDLGVTDLVLCPPNGNPMNVAAVPLDSFHIQWMQHFLAGVLYSTISYSVSSFSALADQGSSCAYVSISY